MWRDPLDELIDDLEAALPSADAPARYEHLPRLEDLQAVIAPILFGTEEERRRIFADPEYQRLSDTVMRQLARVRDDRPTKPSASRDSEVAPSPQRAVNGQKGIPGDSPPGGTRICICGAEGDADHEPECPFASETSR